MLHSARTLPIGHHDGDATLAIAQDVAAELGADVRPHGFPLRYARLKKFARSMGPTPGSSTLPGYTPGLLPFPRSPAWRT
jgi:hypothetical protein